MTFSAEMLRQAAAACGVLDDGAAQVLEFVRGQACADGGYRDRAGSSDLYYTGFALDCLRALGRPVRAEAVVPYLCACRAAEQLDFVHLTTLVRCWSRAGWSAAAAELPGRLAGLLERFRADDGGYHSEPGAAGGSIYGCFLARAAYQDLGLDLPRPGALLDCVRRLRGRDGRYVNEPGIDLASTNATVGGLLLTRDLAGEVDAADVAWLSARQDESGGFLSTPGAPGPDLVSTATAVFALKAAGAPLDALTEGALRFALTLWDERGGFCGHWLDDTPDCEYTFYGLLTIGCLAEAWGRLRHDG